LETAAINQDINQEIIRSKVILGNVQFRTFCVSSPIEEHANIIMPVHIIILPVVFMGVRFSQSRVLRSVAGPKEMKWREAGENYTLRNCIVFRTHFKNY
jgi:hypothetical protein